MTARIELRSAVPGVEISVTDSKFREVAHGVSRLNADVDAGVYQVRLQAGVTVQTELIAVRDGEVHSDPSVKIEFESAAPIQGTTTSHEYHMDAARRASQQLAGMSSGAAGVVVMVRNMRGMDALPLDSARLSGLEWIDRNLAPIPGFGAGWQIDTGDKWAIFLSTVEPGGYALRVTRPDDRGGKFEFEQPIWASAGWQTLVFIPNLTSGPAPEAASIHMTQSYAGWDPFMDPRTSQALELALWNLRTGRGVVADDLLDLLLGSKFQNPMLGIVGAHALLQRSEPDLDLLDKVVGNLRSLLPDHPDVAALGWMSREARAQRDLPQGRYDSIRGGVTWPPMLMASYAALVRLDVSQPGAIADGSTADLVSGRLIRLGTWTAWRRGSRIRRSASTVRRSDRASVPVELTVDYEHPATQRVATYLSGVAELQQIGSLSDLLSQVQPQQISLATGLPTASVQRALSDVSGGKGIM